MTILIVTFHLPRTPRLKRYKNSFASFLMVKLTLKLLT